MRPGFRTVLFAVALALVPAAESLAGIVSVTNITNSLQTLVPPPPANISQGKYESDTVATGFNELQSQTLASNLAVTVLASGLGSLPYTVDHLADETPHGYILAGTKVSSHYFFLDQDEAHSPGTAVVEAQVKFDGDILGVICNTFGSATVYPGNEWNISAAALGLSGVTYTPVDYQGFEYSGDDWWRIDGPRTITIHFYVTSGQDNLRVITAPAAAQALGAVPEPTSLTLLALGLVAWRRRRRA